MHSLLTSSGITRMPSTHKLMVVACALIATTCSQPHQVNRACTPPLSNWNSPHAHLGPPRLHVRIAIDSNGNVYVDSARVSASELAEKMVSLKSLSPSPIVSLETEMGLSCDKLDETRQIIDRYFCMNDGHCDEGIQSLWENVSTTTPVP